GRRHRTAARGGPAAPCHAGRQVWRAHRPVQWSRRSPGDRTTPWGVAGCRDPRRRARQHTWPAPAMAVATLGLARPASHARQPAGRVQARCAQPRPHGDAMHPVSILLLGLAMSTDAFAAALGKGAAMRPRWHDALHTGAIFGVVEAVTPIVGWAMGSVAQRWIEEWDHWIAFGLLCGLGLHLVWKALHGDGGQDGAPRGTGLWAVAVAGLATSIDAMAAGVGL